MTELRYCRMASPVGELTIVENGGAVCALHIGAKGVKQLLHRLEQTHGAAPRHDPRSAPVARKELRAYFAGSLVRFTCPVDLSAGTAFQQRVWHTLRKIPWGRTWSYGQVAAAVGNERACRAVGSANGRNPIPIIVPCHRVVNADGGLGGFGSGLDVKKALLRLESISPSDRKTGWLVAG